MTSTALYLVVLILTTTLIWGIGSFFADKISDYEVIKPKENIECVVVSRMFNTSVDCWKIKQTRP